MTQGEAKVLETDVIIFPMEFNQENQEAIVVEENSATITEEKKTIRADLEIRFARLKKTLRKRSASIL